MNENKQGFFAIRPLSAIAIFFVAALFSTQGFAVETSCPEAEFTVTLPAGWIAIPGSTLDYAEHKLANKLHSTKQLQSACGFEQAPTRQGQQLSYPYILVQVERAGRIPEQEFKQVGEFDPASVSKNLQNTTGSLISNVKISKPFYDAASNVIWGSESMNLAGVGAISMHSAMMPTAYGLVMLTGYALENSPSDNFQTIFSGIVKSMHFSKDAVYKPEWTDNLPTWLRDLTSGNTIKAALLGGLIAAFSGKKLAKRRLKKTTVLILAVEEGSLGKVKDIIARDVVGINEQDSEGWAALHYAVKMKRLDIVNELLSAGADSSIVTGKGESAFQIATTAKWPEGVSRLASTA